MLIRQLGQAAVIVTMLVLAACGKAPPPAPPPPSVGFVVLKTEPVTLTTEAGNV